MYRTELNYFLHVSGGNYNEIFAPDKLKNLTFNCRLGSICNFCKFSDRMQKLLPEKIFSKRLTCRNLISLNNYLDDNAGSVFWIDHFAQFATIFMNRGINFRKIEKILARMDLRQYYSDSRRITVSRLTLLVKIYGFKALVESIDSVYLELAKGEIFEFWSDFVSIVLMRVKSRGDGLGELSLENLKAVYGEI